MSLVSCADNGPDSGDNSTGSDTVQTVDFDYDAGLTSEGFFEGIKATDYVTLPQYKGVSVPASVLVASDEALSHQIDSILASYTEYEKVYDREVTGEDTVNIDYVGKIDGVEFEGGSTKGQGTTVTIGVTAYIEGFLEQLVGHKPGETFDITVTFPDPYEYNDELSGKEAVFTVTINYIQGDPIAAELTDEIAADYGFASKEELVADIKEWIVSQQKLEFFGDIVADAECSEIPDTILDYIKGEEIAYYESMAAMYGMDINSFVSAYTGYESLSAFLESRNELYKETAINYLVVQAIAEQEGLGVSEEDIKNYGYEDHIETYGKSYIKLFLLTKKIVPDFVVENGVVAD